ncbi:MAG: hypothetical protein GQ582_00385 [Methyloprofundus sp.]|nr:hypothetical protein [Methyloprofundus sp.]
MKLLPKLSIALVILLGLIYFAAHFLLESWWFSSLRLGVYFQLRESYEWQVKSITTVFLTLIVYLNFIYVPRALNFSDEQKKLGLIGFLLRHKKLLGLLAFLASIPLLIPIYAHWEDFLLYFYAAPSELTDPVYGRDISFYLFAYPVYSLVQNSLFLFLLLILALVSFLYFTAHKANPDSEDSLPRAAKLHLASLIVGLIVLHAWSIDLERIGLLYEDRHLPVFYGPGFVEMNYGLPLIWISFLVFLSFSATILYSLYFTRKYQLILILGAAYISVIGLKHLDFIPNILDEYYVNPNPVKADGKNIQHHIKATSDAFNLSEVKTIDYALTPTLSRTNFSEIQKELSNIPLWDDDLILPVFEQLQSIRPYFSFYQLAVDRYDLNGENRQVNIAARELDYPNIPDSAKNWRNQHLVYTHGYGMVMSPSNQDASQPMQWLLQNFGQTTEFDQLKIDQPEIFYGLADYSYAIVPNKEALKVGDNTAGDMKTDYAGSGGLPISSLFNKAVLATFFKDQRIFFSAGITDKSRVLVRRNIIKRIQSIAPFLVLGHEPYPIIVNHKIYWIVDAFTHSDKYPLVEPRRLSKSTHKGAAFNYARNSVKIIVDAYTGAVDFYIVDEQDPIVNTYRNMYPSLFKTLADIQMPFIRHFSYPKEWFALQMDLYARFHQKNPEVFYQQSEDLELATMDGKTVDPYYLTIDVDEDQSSLIKDQRKFILVSPMSPINRDNLDSIAIAGCLAAEHCMQHYQEDIYVYKFSNNIQVEGPAQISALINQNPDISAQLTLWNQHGSKVIRGRIVIIPIEHSLLYIQPLYLAAKSATGFPTLAKVIMVINQQSVIADTVEQAFALLQKKLLAPQNGGVSSNKRY